MLGLAGQVVDASAIPGRNGVAGMGHDHGRWGPPARPRLPRADRFEPDAFVFIDLPRFAVVN